MPSKRFVIEVEGRPRSLFSVIERRNETVLGLKSIAINEKLGQTHLNLPIDNPSPVMEQRYSIHPSTESIEDINVIKQTMRLADGRRIIYRHHTKAIKSKDGFAFLFCRRCGHIQLPHFITTSKQTICLGPYDPSVCTLVYAVMVGAPDAEFSPTNLDSTMNVAQHSFNNIKVVVIWTFLAIPASTYWFTAHLETKAEERESWLGLPANICVGAFATYTIEVLEELLERLETLYGIDRDRAFNAVTMTRHGTFTNNARDALLLHWFLTSRKPMFTVDLSKAGIGQWPSHSPRPSFVPPKPQ